MNTDGPHRVYRLGWTLIHSLWIGTVVAVLVAAAPSRPQIEPPHSTPWGEAVNGLQTRLMAEHKAFPADRPVILFVDVRNVSDKTISLSYGEWVEDRLVLTGPGGQLVPLADHCVSGTGKADLPAGQIVALHTLYGPVSYGKLSPGRYTLRWPGGKPPKSSDARPPPPCEALTFEIAEGPAPAPAVTPDHAPVAFGKEAQGLRSRLSAERKTFRIGEPINMRLELKNVSKEPKIYHVPQVFINGRVAVLDAAGKPVPYIGGSAQTINPRITLKPGQTDVVGEGNLAHYYYLEERGKYTAHFPGVEAWGAMPDSDFAGLMERDEPDSPIPASNEFTFEIVGRARAAPGIDAAVGPLTELAENRDYWSLDASPPVGRLVRPGTNFGRTPGRRFCFQHIPTNLKSDMALFSVWVTQSPSPREQWMAWSFPRQPADYIGHGKAGHVYVEIAAEARRRWPTVVDDIRRALGVPTASQPDRGQ